VYSRHNQKRRDRGVKGKAAAYLMLAEKSTAARSVLTDLTTTNRPHDRLCGCRTFPRTDFDTPGSFPATCLVISASSCIIAWKGKIHSIFITQNNKRKIKANLKTDSTKCITQTIQVLL